MFQLLYNEFAVWRQFDGILKVLVGFIKVRSVEKIISF